MSGNDESQQEKTTVGIEAGLGSLSLDERFSLVRSVGEECVQEDELRNLLAHKKDLSAYDGFEPSGRMHIAQGILKAINVNKMTQAGFTFKFWVADFFAKLNGKMGGDISKIRTVGKYMIEIWKAAGMDMNQVEFLWASDEINAKPEEYWLLVMDIATKFNLSRIKRCCTIMGREEQDEMPAAQVLYPCMQCADIFFLGVDVCQLGMDQRKVNMLARDYLNYADVKKKYRFKPVVLSHPMLMGLKQGQAKMSKSDPDSAIYMEDTAAAVKKKINKAFCPPNEVKDNPCMDYLKHIVFGKQSVFEVKRPEKYGGDKVYTSYDEVVVDYESGSLFPGDLKSSLAAALNAMIEPVRQHFQNDPTAKALLEQVRSFKITR